MKSILNISAYRTLAIAAIVFATFVAVFFVFNTSFSNTSLFNEAEACCGSDSGGGSGSSGGGADGSNSERDSGDYGGSGSGSEGWGGGGSIGSSYGSFVYGCTDDSATNYDPQADINDGSCTFPPVEGCTDIYATNYDFYADKDDGSCEYPEVEVTSCDLRASAEIIETGGSVTLTWETEGYEEFTLNGQSVSDPNGSKTFTNILENTTYTFVATNSNGDRCQATVTVQCIPPVVPTCESFNITQSTVAPEADLTFSWNTSNATNVSINNGIGEVAVDGTNEIFSAPAAEGTYTYTLTFDGKTNNSCVDTVKVEKPVVHAPRCDAFNASPEVINTGDASTLTWETTNATRVTINTLGEVAADGSASVSPLTSTTYLLTVFGADNKKDYCEAKVTVEPDVPVKPQCPYTSADGVVVDFGDARIFSSRGAASAQTSPIAVNLAAGNYAVRLVAWDGYADRVDAFQPNEKYKVVFANNSTVVAESNDTDDLADNVVSALFDAQVNSKLTLSSAVDNVYALHSVFPDNSSPNSLNPICAVFIPEEEVDAPVCVAFNANPDTLVRGEQTTLTWEVENAVALGLNNGIGDVTGTTSFGPISPIASTEYILNVFGEDGTKVQCEAPVTVTDPTEPAISIVKRDAADADDTQTVAIGGTANFEIIVTNAGNEDLENVVVTDELESACNATIGTLAVGSSTAYTCNSTNVQSAFTNVAAVTGDSVEDGQTVTDTDPTDVTIEDTAVFTCEDNVSFTASDTSIDRGDSSRLSWNVTGADSVSISQINATGLTGAEDVSPSSDTTYVLTATKAGFDPIDCAVRIDVSSGGGGGGGGSSSPRCELEISDSTISRGDDITLTWDSSRARELILTDDRGDVIVTTEDRLSRDKEELFEGEITLTPTRDTEYTLRVERGSRDEECTVDVELDDEVVLLETRDQAPLVTGISLTEVPYTGFEAGTVMTYLFYALLIAWALYITYVLVIPKTLLSAVPELVTPRNTADHMTSAETVRPDAFTSLPTKSVVTAPKVAAPANLPVAPVVSAEPVAAVEEAAVSDTATLATEVENQAHMYQALLSSSAVQSLIAMTTDADRSETLKKVIADAKGTYPLEDGWVVINQTRLTELTTQPAAPAATALTGNGSLAEAIVTGNVVAAYDLIGARPMFALADASADLDALYRNRKGANEAVSDLLTEATKNMTDEQIADMIAALTGAIDGTYSDEASAVKMAIMKAIKIAA